MTPTSSPASTPSSGPPGRLREALERGDWPAAGAALADEWRARVQLAPAVTTPAIDALLAEAIDAGAWAGKVCGAGGGGCLFCLAPPERTEAHPPPLAARRRDRARDADRARRRSRRGPGTGGRLHEPARRSGGRDQAALLRDLQADDRRRPGPSDRSPQAVADRGRARARRRVHGRVVADAIGMGGRRHRRGRRDDAVSGSESRPASCGRPAAAARARCDRRRSP